MRAFALDSFQPALIAAEFAHTGATALEPAIRRRPAEATVAGLPT
jgi:hypothetical protein